MAEFKPVDEQLATLLRGAAQVETRDELQARSSIAVTRPGTPLRIKYGIDPTGFDVHLGHTVPLRKLRQFQELGHTAVLIIGTATAAVGDPSGRDASRQGLTTEQIETNAADVPHADREGDRRDEGRGAAERRLVRASGASRTC